MNGYDNRDESVGAENSDEITRIQNEIDKMLSTPPPVYTNQMHLSDIAEEHPVPPGNISAQPSETDAGHIPAAAEASYAPLEATAFYRETIKESGKGKNKFRRAVAVIAAVCILGGSLLGYFVGVSSNGANRATEAEPPKPAATEAVSNSEITEKASEESTFAFNQNEKPKIDTSDLNIKNVSDLFVEIINMVEPSVVAITTSAAAQSFWGDSSASGQPASSGSGVIFHEDDEKVYVVTNCHVIEGASGVNVSIGDSKPVSAKLVGADSNEDIAVISITKKDLKSSGIDSVTVAKFGDSGSIQVGEMVLAIGNALGEGNTSTMGLVSAKEKQINISRQNGGQLTVIQTSAAINFGNSGGALVNMNGEVIGINTAKLNPSSGVENMGYSLPSNKVKALVEGFMNRASEAFLGISGVTITPEISAMYKLPEAGVFINSVFEGSSAAKAGLKRTDIITAINGEAVFTMERLTELVKSFEVGDSIEISLIRDGVTPMTVTATLDKYSDVDF